MDKFAIMPESGVSTTSFSLLLRLSRAPADEAAWEEFVDRYGARIHAWCRAWRLQDADAQDVTRAVPGRLAVRLRRFADEPSQNFRGWLRTLVKNACRDSMADRRRSIGAAGIGGDDRADSIQAIEAREELVGRLEAELVSRSHVTRHLECEVRDLEVHPEATPPE